MPVQTIKFVPGVDTQKTPSLNEAAIQSTNRIRFSPGADGLPEKLGGWTKFYPTPIGSTVTNLHAWEDLEGVLHLAFGATAQLGVITSGTLQDITPQTTAANFAPNFSTVAGSPTVTIINYNSSATIYDTIILETQVSVGGLVLSGAYPITNVQSTDIYQITAATNATATVNSGGVVPIFSAALGLSIVNVTLPNHGYSVGSTFTVGVSTVVGGLTLFGFYTVSSVVDANNFYITATTVATSSQVVTMNGGNAQVLYYVTPGPNARGQGYGDGGYGTGGYGVGTTPTVVTGTPITATDWTLDNVGGTLVASPANGPIFTWEPQSGLYTAKMIAQAPVTNAGIFVSYAAQIIMAYGASVLGVQDPLLIRWCSSGDYTSWTADVTNSAGSYRLPRGSKIIGGLQGPLFDIFWTDLEVWSGTYIGQPYIYGFTSLAAGCGLAGKFAAGVLLNTVYWLSYTPPTTPGVAVGSGQFYSLPSGGGVTPLPCSVWDFIFDNVDITHIANIRCGVNSTFGEIFWFFPVVGGSGKTSAYVKFTPQFNAWDYGYLGRSAWIDQSVFGPPIGADAATNYLYQHETANDADGADMGETFTTGYWALSEGQDQMFVDQMMPDMKFGKMGAAQTAVVNVAWSYTDYATGSQVYATPTYTMSSNGPGWVNPRFRGRLVSMTVGGSSLGSFWRLGGLRTRAAVDGRL